MLASKLEEMTGEACSVNDWEFNECFHGATHQAIGVPHCAWSAAGYILAHNRTFIQDLIV